ncbi:MAG: hypothetical protein V3V61_03725 [Gammaproteobacteria bacterium]
MPATLDEHTIYYDVSGRPLVGGKLYIGAVNGDPKSSIPIFADRQLTTPLANPQSLNQYGRSTNKIWVEGKYSLQVDNVGGGQEFQSLDNGQTLSTGITTVSNIQGGNVIVGSGSPSISAYIDKQQYVFVSVSVNTGDVTFNVDNVGAKSVLKNHTEELVAGDIEANQVVIVAFNETDDIFEWTNQNAKVVSFYKGSSVASNATTNIWATDGNTLHITGTTACTSFGTAPNVGARRTIIFDDAVTLTNSANLALQGGADFTTEAGDILEVYADTTTQFDIRISKVDGTAITENILLGTPQATTSGTVIDFTGLTGAKEIKINFDGVSTSGSNSYLIQLGDSGGFETTGYLGTASSIAAGGTGVEVFTTGLGIRNISSGKFLHGTITLTLLDTSTFTWAMTANLSSTGPGGDSTLQSSSSKSLSAALDSIRITTVGASDTFDAGKININSQ